MTNEQNSENKTFGRKTITLSRDEIMGTCNYMLDILAFQEDWISLMKNLFIRLWILA